METGGVEGYVPINVKYAGTSSDDRFTGVSRFGGLERSVSSGAQLSSILDGNVNHANWWYAIGSRVDFRGGERPLSIRSTEAVAVKDTLLTI